MGGFQKDIAGESTGFTGWVGRKVMKGSVEVDGQQADWRNWLLGGAFYRLVTRYFGFECLGSFHARVYRVLEVASFMHSNKTLGFYSHTS